jgi:hypothetical protein
MMAPNAVVIRGFQREAGFNNGAQPPPPDSDVEDGSPAQSGSLERFSQRLRRIANRSLSRDALGTDRASRNEVGEIRRVRNSFLQFLEHDDSDAIILAY